MVSHLEAVIFVQANIAEVCHINEAVHGPTDEVLLVVQHLQEINKCLSEPAQASVTNPAGGGGKNNENSAHD